MPVLLQMSFKQLELLFAALPLSYSQEAVLQIRHLQTTLSCIFHLKEDSVMSSSITTSASDIYNVIQIQKLLNESNITWRDCRSSLSIVDTVNADVIQHGLGWLQDRLPVLLGRFFMMVNVVASVVKCSCVCGCTTKLTCVDTYAEATIVCRKVFGACSLCGVVCATCLADDHHYCHRPQCYCVVRL